MRIALLLLTLTGCFEHETCFDKVVPHEARSVGIASGREHAAVAWTDADGSLLARQVGPEGFVGEPLALPRPEMRGIGGRASALWGVDTSDCGFLPPILQGTSVQMLEVPAPYSVVHDGAAYRMIYFSGILHLRTIDDSGRVTSDVPLDTYQQNIACVSIATDGASLFVLSTSEYGAALVDRIDPDNKVTTIWRSDRAEDRTFHRLWSFGDRLFLDSWFDGRGAIGELTADGRHELIALDPAMSSMHFLDAGGYLLDRATGTELDASFAISGTGEGWSGFVAGARVSMHRADGRLDIAAKPRDAEERMWTATLGTDLPTEMYEECRTSDRWY